MTADFIDFLSAFKWVFNNSINVFIEQTSNEIIYKFNFTDFFDVINNNNAREFKIKHKIHQQKIQDSITWANLVMKNHYNRYHISLLLNLENLIMLKLYHEYHVSDIVEEKSSTRTSLSELNDECWMLDTMLEAGRSPSLYTY